MDFVDDHVSGVTSALSDRYAIERLLTDSEFSNTRIAK